MSKSIDHTHRSSPVKRHNKTLSFSSVLLDSIYRSMEESGEDDIVIEEIKHPPATMGHSLPSSVDIINTTRPTGPNPGPQKATSKKDKSVNLKRAIMIEHWIEKQQEEKAKQSSTPTRRNRSTGSSCSEAADFTSCFTPAQKPLKIRAPSSASGSSPSTKIATFFNSIFTSSRYNKTQRGHLRPVPDARQQINLAASSTTSTSTSACSSASSFARSCLSKSTAPSSTCSISSSGKRSVRFYPLSVIVGEDSLPCGHKCLYDPDPIRSLKSAKLTKIPNLGRSSPWYLRDDHEVDKGFRGNHEIQMKTDADDAESDASSDLFELESIGPMEGRFQYDQELPVYGTTSFEMNKAIANGFLI